MGRRRTLQLSLVIAAIAAMVLALTGAFTPSGAEPVDPPAVISSS